VVLHTSSEAELRSLHAKLLSRNIGHVPIFEPDPPYLGQMTAIGFPPTRDRKSMKRLLGRLELLK